MAEMLLGALIQVLYEKLASRALLNFAKREKLHSLLKRWEKNLQDVQIVLEDAEDRAMGGETRVTPWLDDLRDLAYDVEDLLDEFATEEALRSSSVPSDKASASSSKLRNLVLPSCCTSLLSPRRLAFNHKMRSKVEEIDSRLADIVRRKDMLGLREGSGGQKISGTSQERKLPSTSLVEPFISGRDDDRNVILNFVMDESEDLSVIPIVGMGGVGKTTLAQSVYNDEKVKGSFQVRAWACVSEDFDVLAVTRTILLQLDGGDRSHEGKDLNSLQVELQGRLSGKKFLIVMDDVWNDNYESWTLLRRPFESGRTKGSKIIVTTRSKTVASIMKSRAISEYPLNTLSHDDCRALLAYHALGVKNFDDHPQLKDAGEKIVKQCAGLPLAAKTVGGVLRSKYHVRDWMAIAESKIWDLSETKGVPQALKLSYVYLPPALKRCFAYCTVFPKDHVFDKEDLILLWMAEGLFGRPQPGESMRDHGLKCFQELLDRSFFQPSSGNKSLFVMHDLLNDLATSVAGESCLSVGESQLDSCKEKKSLEKVRYLSVICQEYELSGRFERFHCLRGLRTFLALTSSGFQCYVADMVIDDAIQYQKHLRVLSLCGYRINEVPNCIGSLRHLRYLNLSGSHIRCLPSSMCALYNLETLILKACHELVELPTWINMLINLRCVDISITSSLRTMPRGMSNLIKLEILPKFIVGDNNGARLKELKDLQFLAKKLTIQGLRNVAEVGDARDAALDAKPRLTSLTLSWGLEAEGSPASTTTDSSSQMQVLEWLQPHAEITNLEIEGYGGTMFPCWIGSISFVLLESVTLRNCSKTETLPSLGLLPLLKELGVRGMNAVSAVGHEFYGNTAEPFPSLETLAFSDMSAWERWSFPVSGCEQGNYPFPRLRELRLRNCPKLIIEKWPSQLPCLVKLATENCPLLETPVSTINLPSLEEGEFRDCDGRMLRGVISISSSLKRLTMVNIARISDLTSFLKRVGSLSSLASLEELSIVRCDELMRLWWEEDKKDDRVGTNDHMKNHSLKRLTIESCPQLVKIGAFPPNLENLFLKKCKKLEELPYNMPTSSPTEERRSVNNHEIDGSSGSSSSNGSERSNNDRTMWCQLQELVIWDCPSLMPFHSELSSLKRLDILRSEVLLELEGILCTDTVGPHHSELEDISIDGCEKMKSLTPHLHNQFTRLTSLFLGDCPVLELECFPQLPNSLRDLSIHNCPGIKALPQRMQAHLSLRTLDIRSCSGIASLFPVEGLPPNLEELCVRECENMSLQCFPQLPNSLRGLSIDNCPGIKALPQQMQAHLSMRQLWISNCPGIASLFPVEDEEGLPQNLEVLMVSDCENLMQPMSKWGLQRTIALKRLRITGKIGCLEGANSFPPAEDGQEEGSWHVLPPSLTRLGIRNQENLMRLSSGMQSHLTCLQSLSIGGCRKLRRLPREGFPASLGNLRILGCSKELVKRCSKEGGGGCFGSRDYYYYFPLIRCIPSVNVYADGE